MVFESDILDPFGAPRVALSLNLGDVGTFFQNLYSYNFFAFIQLAVSFFLVFLPVLSIFLDLRFFKEGSVVWRFVSLRSSRFRGHFISPFSPSFFSSWGCPDPFKSAPGFLFFLPTEARLTGILFFSPLPSSLSSSSRIRSFASFLFLASFSRRFSALLARRAVFVSCYPFASSPG